MILLFIMTSHDIGLAETLLSSWIMSLNCHQVCFDFFIIIFLQIHVQCD